MKGDIVAVSMTEFRKRERKEQKGVQKKRKCQGGKTHKS